MGFWSYGQNNIPVINEVKATVNPLDTLQFDEIIAYTINYDTVNKRRTYDQMDYRVNEYNLSPLYTSAQRKVKPEMFDDIIKTFSDTATYGSNYADCFEPRFVLQFKFEQKECFRIVICEGCGFLVSTLPIPAAYQKYYDNEYEDEGKTVIYRRYLKGFSEIGAKKINELCKALNMAYCRN